MAPKDIRIKRPWSYARYRKGKPGKLNMSAHRKKPGPKKRKKNSNTCFASSSTINASDEIVQITEIRIDESFEQCKPIIQHNSNNKNDRVSLDSNTCFASSSILNASDEIVHITEISIDESFEQCEPTIQCDFNNEDDGVSLIQGDEIRSSTPIPKENNMDLDSGITTVHEEDNHLIIESCQSAESEPIILSRNSRRIVNIQHFLKQLQEYDDHSEGLFDCRLRNLKIINEFQRGLLSAFTLKCDMCGFKKTITTDLDEDHSLGLDVTTATVAATYEASLGLQVLNSILGVMNIPQTSSRTYADKSQVLNQQYVSLVEMSMKKAAECEIDKLTCLRRVELEV